MNEPELLFTLFGLPIARSVFTSWLVIAILVALCLLPSNNIVNPSRLQTVMESLVMAIEKSINDVLPTHGRRLLPFIGTLWIYIGIANLAGIIPGCASPTADLSTTTALAALVFLAVHWYGIQVEGWKQYLRHYAYPSIWLLPLHLVGEISRTLALALRLFGNVMSLEIAAMLVLLVAGFLVPVPLLMLHIVEAIVQAYIFGMLALVYISGGIQANTPIKQAAPPFISPQQGKTP